MMGMAGAGPLQVAAIRQQPDGADVPTFQIGKFCGHLGIATLGVYRQAAGQALVPKKLYGVLHPLGAEIGFRWRQGAGESVDRHLVCDDRCVLGWAAVQQWLSEGHLNRKVASRLR